MSIRKLWINRAKFFLLLRHPLLSIFFISICLVYNIFNLMACISPPLLDTHSGCISFLAFNTFRISALMYTIYIIFYAIVQQYTVLHRLNNAQNTHIRRLLFALIQSSSAHTVQHDNVARTIFVVYNLFAAIITILITTTSSVSLPFSYRLIMTPQFVLLNAFVVLMYKYTPREYEDMFGFKKQWNYIALAIVMPLNLMLLSLYLFPAYFALIHLIADLLLLFQFTWVISTYPITLHLQSERQHASMRHPDTWQECLCQDSRDLDSIQLLDIPTDDAISYINGNMFNDRADSVSPAKLEWFMREFGYSSSKDEEFCCVSEFLFLVEMTQIKARIASIIGAVANDECGV
eukprot:377426_1